MQIGTVTKTEGTNESYIFEYIEGEGEAGTTWPGLCVAMYIHHSVFVCHESSMLQNITC